jgi:hypothetical protein
MLVPVIILLGEVPIFVMITGVLCFLAFHICSKWNARAAAVSVSLVGVCFSLLGAWFIGPVHVHVGSFEFFASWIIAMLSSGLPAIFGSWSTIRSLKKATDPHPIRVGIVSALIVLPVGLLLASLIGHVIWTAPEL